MGFVSVRLKLVTNTATEIEANKVLMVKGAPRIFVYMMPEVTKIWPTSGT